MTVAEHSAPHLIDRLPHVRGRLTANAPLAPQTWFRVGGPAEVLFKPADRADLSAFLADCPANVPLTVIGVASNLLVRDGGVPGVVIRLGGPFADVATGDDFVLAGAGALDTTVAAAAQAASLAGLEFLSGIPGTIGGAVAMNAGAYGGEIANILTEAEIMLRDGTIQALPAASLGLSYRHSELPPGSIVLSARFRAQPGKAEAIAAAMAAIETARGDSQPVRARTGGSTFANPPGHKAWQLIDQAGCRGLSHGGAQVSEKHCNFLLNNGTATARDLERLGEEVRRRVFRTSGIELRWEIKCIGEPS
jgi:UDP-N-acetylmuramate dehydrogenase